MSTAGDKNGEKNERWRKWNSDEFIAYHLSCSAASSSSMVYYFIVLFCFAFAVRCTQFSFFTKLFRIFRLYCTHYIHFRSKNRTIIVIFYFPYTQSRRTAHSILWHARFSNWRLTPFSPILAKRHRTWCCQNSLTKGKGSTPHVHDLIKTTLSRFRHVSLFISCSSSTIFFCSRFYLELRSQTLL